MNKIKVCVLFGGVSSEHEVSLVSAASVLRNMNPEKYEIHKIFITREGLWYYYDGDADGLAELDNTSGKGLDRAILSPDRGHKAILRFRGDKAEALPVDLAYPVLHGKNGEDGTVQGLFELAGIPYVGSGVLGSAVCMDKCLAKVMFAAQNIPQADWVEIRPGEDKIEEIEEKLGYPCFVKPPNAGSSVGVTKAHNREELQNGIALAFRHDTKVLVEEMLYGSEVECSVIGNGHPEAAPVLGEIAPAAEFYDYDAKYNDANSELTIPAQLPDDVVQKVREYAVRAYTACECRGLSRVDFFVNKDTGDIRLNEINTLPGFTSISMYPKLWIASGVSYGELIDRLIAYAME